MTTPLRISAAGPVEAWGRSELTHDARSNRMRAS
jgi:hypothetical protein